MPGTASQLQKGIGEGGEEAGEDIAKPLLRQLFVYVSAPGKGLYPFTHYIHGYLQRIKTEISCKCIIDGLLLEGERGAATVKPAAVANAPLNKCNAFKMFINSLDSSILIFIF